MASTNTYTPIVRLAEDVEDKIYNFSPSDTPLVSSIGRTKVSAHFHEWTADTYRAANGANAAQEGAAAVFAAAAQPVNYGNRTQIVQQTVSVSGTGEAVRKYGRDSEVARLKSKAMVELKKDIEAAAIGNATAIAHAAGVGGQMRGLFGWVATNDSLGVGGVSPNPTTNTAPTAGTLRALTQTLVDDVIMGVYNSGGDAQVLLVSPSHKRAVSNFIDASVQRTNEVTTFKGKIAYYTAYSVYGHDFGNTMVVPDRVMSSGGAGLVNTAYVVDYDKLQLGQLRPFQSKKIGPAGDSEDWQILTEVTLIVDQEATLGAVRDLTATGL